MKKFYLFNRGKQEGPYSLAELQEKEIKLSTLVWHKGIPGWQYAGVIPELQSLFISSHMQQGSVLVASQSKSNPISKNIWIIGLILLLVALGLFLTYNYFSSFDIKP